VALSRWLRTTLPQPPLKRGMPWACRGCALRTAVRIPTVQTVVVVGLWMGRVAGQAAWLTLACVPCPHKRVETHPVPGYAYSVKGVLLGAAAFKSWFERRLGGARLPTQSLRLEAQFGPFCSLLPLPHEREQLRLALGGRQ
jgi:hypothetical protein